MAKQEKQELTEVSTAALALEEELRKFAHLVEVAQRDPLNTQKHLERTAQTLQQLSEADQRLGGALQALVAAINGIRQKQQGWVDAVVTRAREVEQRSVLLQQLLEHYGKLGEVAGQLNTIAQQIVSQAREATTPEKVAELFGAVKNLQEQMGQAAEGAEQLVNAAGQVGFVDVEREAESLRQQLLSSRNKLGLLQKSLTQG
jgi:methyl-accepting chemotaxis protein